MRVLTNTTVGRVKKTIMNLASITTMKHPKITISAKICKPEDYSPILISSSRVAYEILQDVFDQDEMCLCENFYVLVMNQRNELIGVMHHSKGGITGTVVDVKLLMSSIILLGAQGLILAHNHPSGNLKASEADLSITRKIKQAAELLELKVMDHVIVSHNGYYSFADDGMMG